MRERKNSIYAKYIKRILDFLISLIASIALLPLMLILAIIGAIAMSGNPFFIQERPGKINQKSGNEKIFKLIKFRTMTNEKDDDGNLLSSNQRLNKYGKFLRKTSLDELPQLFNVLLGDMSIIGPRPLLVKYLPLYTDKQRHRHDVRPGLTGYAQVSGRNSLSWEEKFKLDVYYVNNISFLFDISIVFKTIFSVLLHKNIEGNGTAIIEEYKGTEKEEILS